VFLLRDRRRQLHASIHLVARELDYNAEPVERYRARHGSVDTLQTQLRLDDWETHERTVHAFSKDDPQLWDEVADAYDALRTTKLRGTDPPDESRQQAHKNAPAQARAWPAGALTCGRRSEMTITYLDTATLGEARTGFVPSAEDCADLDKRATSLTNAAEMFSFRLRWLDEALDAAVGEEGFEEMVPSHEEIGRAYCALMNLRSDAGLLRVCVDVSMKCLDSFRMHRNEVDFQAGRREEAKNDA
jgi:hypothetical protein